MSSHPLRLGLIYGSSRRGRFCDRVGDWTRQRLAESEQFEVDLIDPQRLDLPALLHHDDGAETKALRRRIGHADCFIVVTPEYNHAYPAALKLVIDSVGAEWREKPLGFVCYGGISGGLRAVEQLRLVFAELHAVAIRDCVSIAFPWRALDAEGRLAPPDATEEAMLLMLGRLRHWAFTLKPARGSAAPAPAG